MREKTGGFLKNVTAMLFANGISFLISALITLILPKFLDIEKYAYIQLYIFYTSYVSYLHYGWVDGIRLRYGGAYYEKLDKPLFGSQVWAYVLLQIVVSLAVICFVLLGRFADNRKITLLAVGLCMLLRLPRLMPQYIMEMTNRIKECARITILERMVYLALTLFVIISGKVSVAALLCCDLMGQLVSAAYAFWSCRDLLATKPAGMKAAVTEAGRNIRSGIQLTVANISSLLIIGIIRQCIEKQWDVETFGKISLTISISNFLMVFIRAVSQVMFPTLRRTDAEKQLQIYGTLRTGLMMLLLGMLVFYYPLQMVLSRWLPQYAESLEYMALLFPMCIFESKMSMLVETYLKTIRMEGQLLRINILTVVLSALLAFLTTFVLRNLTMAVISIVVLLAFRSAVAEVVLAKKMGFAVKRHICLELLMVVVFIVASWFVGGIAGLAIYFGSYLLYLYFERDDCRRAIQVFRKR